MVTTKTLLCFAIVATVFTSSMALKCYFGNQGETVEKTCDSSVKNCVKAISKGVVAYKCDDADNKIAALTGGDKCKVNDNENTVCACATDLCNAGNLNKQSFVLGLVTVIVSLVLLA